MSCVSLRDLIGCKFKVHGRTKEEGFDCYGLAIEVLRRNGITLPDVFYDTIENRQTIYNALYDSIPSTKIDNPENMCIILISENDQPVHIGVYIGDGQFIHTTHKTGVVIEPLYRWKPKIVGYYKVSSN